MLGGSCPRDSKNVSSVYVGLVQLIKLVGVVVDSNLDNKRFLPYQLTITVTIIERRLKLYLFHVIGGYLYNLLNR